MVLISFSFLFYWFILLLYKPCLLQVCWCPQKVRFNKAGRIYKSWWWVALFFLTRWTELLCIQNHEDAHGCHMKLSLPVTSESERNSMLTCGDPEAVSECEVSVLGSWQTKCPFGLVDPLTSYRQRSAKRSRRARFSLKRRRKAPLSRKTASLLSTVCSKKWRTCTKTRTARAGSPHTCPPQCCSQRWDAACWRHPSFPVKFSALSKRRNFLEKEFLKQAFWISGRIFIHTHL